uniref:Antitoxin n=1 Tax=Geoglobus ahangari TaxID=113653 RepID=A0A7C3UH77_9EURY
MPKIIEAVYENGVFKPLQKVDLKEGEKVRLKIEKRMLNFDPIDLGEPVSIEKIKELRDELWMSS